MLLPMVESCRFIGCEIKVKDVHSNSTMMITSLATNLSSQNMMLMEI